MRRVESGNPTMFSSQSRFGEFLDFGEWTNWESVIQELQRRYGTAELPHVEGDRGQLAEVGRASLYVADAAETRLFQARDELPQAEEHLRRLERSANGKWMLLGTLGLIALVVLIVGQVM